MTKKHFIRAAEIVNSIQAGHWTHEFPSWAASRTFDSESTDYTRAVHTAEAFIILFSEDNPRFDTKRFLKACGLVE